MPVTPIHSGKYWIRAATLVRPGASALSVATMIVVTPAWRILATVSPMAAELSLRLYSATSSNFPPQMRSKLLSNCATRALADVSW